MPVVLPILSGIFKPSRDLDVKGNLMQIRILQSGDDVTLVIPRVVADAAYLEPGGVVEASVRDGRLVVAPTSRPKYTLEELLAQVTDENRHDEISTGSPVGEEIW